MLLDEPFSNLDPTFRSALTKELLKIKKEGRTILLSTHVLNDLQELADNITMIKEGKIVYDGAKTPDIQKTYEENYLGKENKGFFSL